jgi:hypothetical protein
MKTTTSTQYFSIRRTWLLRSAAAVLAVGAALMAAPQPAQAGVFIGVGISVGFPPPLLPVYVQPAIPAPGYIWTPGYWAWDGAEYYWVPGTWILPPYYGALWTPGYWGWAGGAYIFHAGYWGPHIGFYGGVNYGFGYTGVGYVGGHWGPGGFYYNRTVNQFGGVHITNVYNQTVVNNTYINRTSYNGGQGGLAARATSQQMAFARDPHNVGPIAAQQQQMHAASQNRAMFASVNHGAPAIAATQRAGAFTGAGVMAARGAAPMAAGAAAGRFTPAAAAANAQHVNGNNMAMRSASFAPHANTPNMAAAQHTPTFNNAARAPANVSHPSYNNASAHTASTYRPQAASYHATPQYHAAAPAYHPAPQYHAAAPAYHAAARPSYSAPRGGGGGGRPSGGGGGGHDSRHG